jgi:hypothetical protein
MRQNVVPMSKNVLTGLLSIAFAALLAGCSGASAPQATPAVRDTAAADAAQANEIDAREQALAQREAEFAAQEQAQETARQQAADAAQQQREAAVRTAAAKKAALAKSATAKKANVATARTAAAVAAPVVLKASPIEVPAGTQLTVALSSDLSSKTARPGDAFEARLVSDLMVNERRAALAGSPVTGTITDVVSGSRAIGAVPMLGLKFDRLALNDGQQIPISGALVQQGRSEKGRDSAKIVGGAAAGAILGHQVKNNDTGTIVGGLLGGAIGAVAAKKTGTEVLLAAGSTLTITLGQAFTVVPSL